MSDAVLPLTGVRVVDLADERGELAGRILADLGAEVVRVEPPGGAVSRTFPPFAPDGSSLYFAYRNSNKQGVTADLTTPEGLETVRALIADADVVLEAFRPGELAALGLDPVALRAEHPELIVASLTDFGQTGPYAGFAGTDDVVVALSGWLATSGIPSKPPLLVPGALAYDTLGVLGAYAVLCALRDRLETGHGTHLDVSALEATTQMNTWGIPNTKATLNADMPPPTLRSGQSPVYPTVKTADGAIRLVILAPRQWQAMWEWMGSPEVFADPMWAQTVTRIMNADVLNPFLEAHFAEMGMVEAAAEAQRRGVVATPMLKPSDVLENEHFLARGTIVDAEVLPGLRAAVPSGFFELDGVRAGIRSAAPAGGGSATFTAESRTADAAPAPSAPRPADRQPLAGIRVIDFGHGGVGVEGGRMLAEYGAQVIKVETRTYPDFIRIVMGSEMTPSFASSSRTKLSFGVNTKTPEGLAVLHRLIASAHIVIENNSTGTMDAMGVGYERLRELNPDIVMVSSQLMGSHGPYADWIGYGPTLQTAGGLSWLWNFDDGEDPPGNPAIHPDHLAGRLCAIAGLAGLIGQKLHGHRGVHAEVAQVEAMVCTLGDLFAAESLTPGSVTPEGNADRRGAPWGVFPCAGEQQWAVVCTRDDADWAALVEVMGSPAWATDPAYATTAGRIAARAAVEEGVTAWTSGLSPQEVMERCQAAGVPAGAMLTSFDQMSDPHFTARGFCLPVDQIDLGPLLLEGPCFTGDTWPTPPVFRAPRLGEHTRMVCTELLGMDPTEVEALIASGALEVSAEG
jgi:crotonobetainyl-CoA:carnitine CoA-transferase CaiB-like acyl-CoA transferase